MAGLAAPHGYCGSGGGCGSLRLAARDNGALRGEIARLQHDPAKIEQLARERLGYVRKGETVYQLSPDPMKDRSLQEAP